MQLTRTPGGLIGMKIDCTFTADSMQAKNLEEMAKNGLTVDAEGRLPSEVEIQRYGGAALVMMPTLLILATWKAPGSEFGNETRIKAIPSGNTITAWVTAVDPAGLIDIGAAQAKMVPGVVPGMSDEDGQGDMGSCTLSPAEPLPPMSIYKADDTSG